MVWVLWQKNATNTSLKFVLVSIAVPVRRHIDLCLYVGTLNLYRDYNRDSSFYMWLFI